MRLQEAQRMQHQITQLRQENARLRQAGETLCNMYVANRGKANRGRSLEFISCITAKTLRDMSSQQRGKESRVWAAWDAMRKALGDTLETKDIAS